MKINDYYEKLNRECQKIFENTLLSPEPFAKVHHFSTCIFEFADNLSDRQESDLLKAVSSQIEISALNTSFGLYRQAFSSMRLVLEMGLGMVYFSAFKLEYREWLAGQADIKWSKIINKENGVLSKRFAKAFFPGLDELTDEYYIMATNVYRYLSEFVHGNYDTWEPSGLTLLKNDDLIRRYFEYSAMVEKVLLFCLCCRFLKEFSNERIESMSFVLEEMGHHEYIRVFVGGPKEC